MQTVSWFCLDADFHTIHEDEAQTSICRNQYFLRNSDPQGRRKLCDLLITFHQVVRLRLFEVRLAIRRQRLLLKLCCLVTLC